MRKPATPLLIFSAVFFLSVCAPILSFSETDRPAVGSQFFDAGQVYSAFASMVNDSGKKQESRLTISSQFGNVSSSIVASTSYQSLKKVIAVLKKLKKSSGGGGGN